MQTVTRVGLDIAKSVFQVYRVWGSQSWHVPDLGQTVELPRRTWLPIGGIKFDAQVRRPEAFEITGI